MYYKVQMYQDFFSNNRSKTKLFKHQQLEVIRSLRGFVAGSFGQKMAFLHVLFVHII